MAAKPKPGTKGGGSGNPLGRKPDPKPDEIKARIQAYIDECDATGRFPTESGMMLYLNLVGERQARYLAKKEYADIWEWAKLKRIDWLENQMVTNPRCAQGCMNALKQEKNGGYVDRTQTDAKNKSLTVKLTGVGGKEAAG